MEDDWWETENNEDTAVDIKMSFSRLIEEFHKWIIEAVRDRPLQKKADFENILSPDSVILNFNYTETIENLYKFRNILHIHGRINDMHSIILGHREYVDQDYDLRFTGAYEIATLEEDLRKDVNKIINDNSNFFETLKNINEVYVYGFSFSKVDKPYIKKIIASIDKSAIWYLHGSKVESKNMCDYSEKLISMGCKNIGIWPK